MPFLLRLLTFGPGKENEYAKVGCQEPATDGRASEGEPRHCEAHQQNVASVPPGKGCARGCTYELSEGSEGNETARWRNSKTGTIVAHAECVRGGGRKVSETVDLVRYASHPVIRTNECKTSRSLFHTIKIIETRTSRSAPIHGYEKL